MKKVLLIAGVAAAVAACAKGEAPERVPQKVEFTKRTLPSGIVPGYRYSSEVQAVDLGLSVLWSSVNLGVESSSATDSQGGYFAWGEIFASGNYSWSDYEFNSSSDRSPEHVANSKDHMLLNLTKYCFDSYGEINDVNPGAELDLLDDPAYIAWGYGWRTPSPQQWEELVKECKWVYDKKYKQFTVTGRNGNSITIPLPGYAVGDRVSKPGESEAYLQSGYWTSELSDFSSADAKMLMMSGTDTNEFSIELNPGHNRCFGHPVRPVKNR